MPLKYHIPIKPVPPRFYPVPKNILLESEENCLHCACCGKELCSYDAYGQRYIDPLSGFDTINNLCKDCFRCIQGCIQGTISKVPNPEYQDLGDGYWTPEIISTSIDLGRKPLFLSLDERGEVNMPVFPRVELPLPIILAESTPAVSKTRVRFALTLAAQILNSLVILPRPQIQAELVPYARYLVPQYPIETLNLDDALLGMVRVVELIDHPEVMMAVENLKARYPEVVVSINVPAAHPEGWARPTGPNSPAASGMALFCAGQARGPTTLQPTLPALRSSLAAGGRRIYRPELL